MPADYPRDPDHVIRACKRPSDILPVSPWKTRGKWVEPDGHEERIQALIARVERECPELQRGRLGAADGKGGDRP